MTDDARDDCTLAICIRCAQLFPARATCPWCADLRVAVWEDAAADDPAAAWTFEIWRTPEGAAGDAAGPERVLIVHGFHDAAAAAAEAHEFVRRYVAERLAAQARSGSR